MVAEKGVTASGYGTEYAWQIRTVSYSPVGDEVTNRAVMHFSMHFNSLYIPY